MIWSHLLFRRILQVSHPSLQLLQVYVAKTSVEEHLTRIQLEFEAQLFVINVRITPEIKECVVEVDECFFEIADQEIGDTLLEVCDGQVIVKSNCSLIAFNLLIHQ